MKKVIFLSILSMLFISNLLFSQGYYYQGRYISLQTRNDGIAIIFKQNNLKDEEISNYMSSNLEFGDELKVNGKEYCYIKFDSDKNSSKVLSYIQKFNNKNELIKFVTPVYYGSSRSVTEFPNDEFIVSLKNLKDKAALDILNFQNNCYIKGQISDEYGYVIKTFDSNSKNILDLLDNYFNSGIFTYVEPNMQYVAEGFFNWTPNDTYYNLQWHLSNTGQSVLTGGSTTYGDASTSTGYPGADMEVNLAWDYVKGNQNVTVAVFDTGVDSLHPDLAGNLIVGYNAYANTNTNTTDSGSHGTCTIGLIGARSNNNVGIAGIVGGDNGLNHCKICSYRLTDNTGAFITDVNIARAFDTARVRGVSVSSNSWGGGLPNTTLMNAINNLANYGRAGLGCVILFSSGNDGNNPPSYPSYLANVVCVGASTNIDSKKSAGTGDQMWWGGCYGEDSNGDLDLVAPTITTTTDIRGSGGYSTTDYDNTFNGTSCSCPNAAGVAALILSVNPNLTRSQVLDYLYRGCDKIDNIPYSTTKTYGKWNPYTGYGRVNAYNSVRLAAGVDVIPPTINHLNSTNVSSSTYPLIINAEIIDQDGSAVPTSGSNAPLLYYRKNLNNGGWSSFTNISASSNSGNTFYFKIPCSGWQTEIQYYFLAKDNSGNSTTFPKNSPAYPCYTSIGTTSTTSGTFSSFSLPSTGASASSNLNIADFKIIDASVTLNVTHSKVQDFLLMLWSPLSDTKRNRICLFSHNGSGANITGSTVSDGGTYYWRESSPPYTNLSVKPEYYFTSLRGTSSSGNWKVIYYNDSKLGSSGTFNNATLNIKRLSGTTSSCARLDSPADSIAYYGSGNAVDFYLYNVGTSALNISSYNITGTYASYFSLINTPPTSIAPNSSGLFQIQLSSALENNIVSGNNINNLDNFENAILNINCNDPSKPVFKVSIQGDAIVNTANCVYSTSSINDGSPLGNGNGQMDFGETNKLNLEMINSGTGNASNVNVSVTTTDTYITMPNIPVSYGTINAGLTKTMTDAFTYNVDPLIPDNHIVAFNVSATDGTSTWNSSFNITAHGNLRPQAATVIHPVNGDTSVYKPTLRLQWNAPSSGYAPTGYKVYLGTNSTPPYILTLDASSTSYTPSGLNYNTLYYWKIVPYNANGDALSTDVWSFTTQDNPNFGGGSTIEGGYFFANSTADANTLSKPTYNWLNDATNEIATMTIGDFNDGYFYTNIGFQFPFFGTNYTDVYINSNGFITFGSGSLINTNVAIPTSSVPNNFIAGAWKDLDVRTAYGSTPKILYGGNASRFVITYYQVVNYSSSMLFGLRDNLTFQIILYSSGLITIQYRADQTTTPLTNAVIKSCTVGIEGPDGTKGVNYRFAQNENDISGGPMFDGLGNLALSFSTTQSALTVSLTNFNYKLNKNNVNLNWGTSCENNNYGFEIERKSESGNWEKVGFIEGKGNTTSSTSYKYSDKVPNPGKYNYRLKQIDIGGNFEYHNMNGVVDIAMPKKYQLSQNYPNPFNPTTKIDFDLPTDGKVSIKVFDITGREVKSLVNEFRTAGYYTVSFDASGLASGIYLYQIQTQDNKYIMTKKMVVLK